MTDGGSDHIEFLGSFEALDDTRQQAKVLYPLPEILLLCLCAVLGGADSWVEVALYGQRKLGFLRRLLRWPRSVGQLGGYYEVYPVGCQPALPCRDQAAVKGVGSGEGVNEPGICG